MLNRSMKLAGICAAALIAYSASSFAADVTGTVNVSGSVGVRCAVIDGNNATGSFTGAIPLGELAQSNGTLAANLSGSTTGSPAGTPVSFQVNCNTGVPSVSLTATSMTTPGAAGAGFANQVRYTAELDANVSPSGSNSFIYNTATGTGNATSPTAMTGPLLNAAGNVTVKVYGLSTPNVTDLLVAGNYGGGGVNGGVISITINNN